MNLKREEEEGARARGREREMAQRSYRNDTSIPLHVRPTRAHTHPHLPTHTDTDKPLCGMRRPHTTVGFLRPQNPSPSSQWCKTARPSKFTLYTYTEWLRTKIFLVGKIFISSSSKRNMSPSMFWIRI